MIDLSNNNGTSQDFEVVHKKGGQLRVYLKCVEGLDFVDQTFQPLKKAAEAAGLRVGAYNFLHPLQSTPSEVASYFLSHVGPLRKGHELRPCLDIEWGISDPKVGVWVTELAALILKETKEKPLIYGSGYFLQECEFAKAPGPLWLAAYGRNDGKEYPVGALPHPWTTMAAHQYTSNGTMIGIKGRVDISHVFIPQSIEL